VEFFFSNNSQHYVRDEHFKVSQGCVETLFRWGGGKRLRFL